MSTLHIYDSQGNPVGDSGGEYNEQIEEFFFDGVKLIVDTTDGYELTLFFRARESEAGRAEQYYAVYQTDKSTGLFERFERAFRDEVEEAQGMILETSTDDARLVSLLSTDPPLPDTENEHNSISSLLAEGGQLTIGVENPKAAFAVMRHYFASPANRTVIVDSIGDDMMVEYDFAIEYGSYTGIEPIGEATEAFDEHLRRAAANSARPRAANSGSPGSKSYSDRAKTIGTDGLAILAGALIMAVILILAVNGAASIGIAIPSMESLIFV